jgi:hypothetical protein
MVKGPELDDPVPVPVSDTACGEFAELADTFRLADSLATDVGVKVTLTVQLPLVARVNGTELQVVEVIEKSVLPVIPTLLTLSVCVAEVFVMVIICGVALLPCATLPKATELGETDNAPEALMPVPVNVADCGEFVELPLTVSVPVSEVVTVGV